MKMKAKIAVLLFTLAPVGANAQLTVDVNAITCQQYMSMPPELSSHFSAWMSGWFSYQTRRTFVDFATHQKNITNVKNWCWWHPQDSVMNGLKNAIGPQ